MSPQDREGLLFVLYGALAGFVLGMLGLGVQELAGVYGWFG